jgi:hypothetical protein
VQSASLDHESCTSSPYCQILMFEHSTDCTFRDFGHLLLRVSRVSVNWPTLFYGVGCWAVGSSAVGSSMSQERVVSTKGYRLVSIFLELFFFEKFIENSQFFEKISINSINSIKTKKKNYRFGFYIGVRK